MTPHDAALSLFDSRFRDQPDYVVRAPGRVNLIGEHTDYNDGFVFPMAIERTTWVALRRREDRRVKLASLGYEDAEFSLDHLERAGGGWTEYLKGLAWAIGSDGLAGWDGALATDIPVGAGLSSSAALEIAGARAFAAVSEWAWDPKAAAIAARRGDNDWVGIGSGIMDQLIVATAVQGNAMLIDCRSLRLEPTPLPRDVAVVIMDTGTRRELVDSEYNARRAACERAARVAGVDALRDVAVADLGRLADRLDDATFRRARHVVTENARTLAAASALADGDSDRFGALMRESHASLRDDYEVSSEALDVMVTIAASVEGCLGARMTGAGFGGSAVALVDDAATEDFVSQVAARYGAELGITPAVYVSKAAAGASLHEPEEFKS